MASYTMQLREYIEHATQYEEGLSHRERIEKGRKLLFDFDYPIFDESFKAVFETNFIRKFYMREIGFETEGLFKFQLETWLLINMPYYNKLFESEQMKYNPLYNSEIKTTYNKTKDTDTIVDTETTGDSVGTNEQKMIGKQNDTTNDTETITNNENYTDKDFNRSVLSNTPEDRLQITTNNNGEGVIEYASSITENSDLKNGDKTTNIDGVNNRTSQSDRQNDINGRSTDTTNVKGNTVSDVTEIEDYIQNTVGKIGSISYPEMIMKYRESLIRIENMIHNDMQQLFMMIY